MKHIFGTDNDKPTRSSSWVHLICPFSFFWPLHHHSVVTAVATKTWWQLKFAHWFTDVEQSSFHSLKAHTGSSLPSSQGWIHGVSVLLCSPAYDLFICGVEHSDNPPTTPSSHHTLHPQPPTSVIRKIEGCTIWKYTVKLIQLYVPVPILIKCIVWILLYIQYCVCAMTKTGQIRTGERTHDALSTWYAL